MADTVTTRWLYPPNWDGFVDPTGYLKRGWKHMVVNFTNYSDSTGETDVRKVTRADLYGPSGLQCRRLCIEEIIYHTYGMGVVIEFDMAPDELVCYLPQNDNGTILGPFLPDIAKTDDYPPGATGDIFFTTVDAAAKDTYDITLKLRIKEV